MSALELADWIKNTEFYNNSDPNINDRMDEVEVMLRQQQAEIEALKKELALWRLSKSSEEIEQVPTNPTLMGGLAEPVGHFYPEGEGATVYDIKFAWKVTGTTEPIPLYIHPAKTLTDEEILALWTQKNNLNGAKDVVDFARAILKKESDK